EKRHGAWLAGNGAESQLVSHKDLGIGERVVVRRGCRKVAVWRGHLRREGRKYLPGHARGDLQPNRIAFVIFEEGENRITEQADIVGANFRTVGGGRDLALHTFDIDIIVDAGDSLAGLANDPARSGLFATSISG